jgi:hypothetical protein
MNTGENGGNRLTQWAGRTCVIIRYNLKSFGKYISFNIFLNQHSGPYCYHSHRLWSPASPRSAIQHVTGARNPHSDATLLRSDITQQAARPTVFVVAERVACIMLFARKSEAVSARTIFRALSIRAHKYRDAFNFEIWETANDCEWQRRERLTVNCKFAVVLMQLLLEEHYRDTSLR